MMKDLPMNTKSLRRARLLCTLLACGTTLPALVGCGGGTTGAGAGAVAMGPTMKRCPDGVLDDLEDGDGQTTAARGRGGYWYTYADKASRVAPASKFTPTTGGAHGSRYAARVSGKTGGDDVTYAGIGFSFVDPKGAYDASAYGGISFKAKVAKGSNREVRLKVSDGNTDPDGKKCKQCYNDFGAELVLTEEWKPYTVPFPIMKQESGWGDLKPAIDPKRLYGFMVQVKEQFADFDIWIDDIEFVCE